jgi:16S rRNA (cytosine967-C5)-methyltransferase
MGGPTTTARGIALRIIESVSRGRTYSDAARSALSRSRLDARDRQFALRLASGVVTMRRRLTRELDVRLEKRALEQLPSPIAVCLQLGLYQLRFEDSTPDRAAVSESVDLAKAYGHKGTASLVNAVLRSASRGGEPPLPDDPVERVAVETSHSDWMVRRWEERFGLTGAEALGRFNNLPAPLSLRVRPGVDRDTLFSIWEERSFFPQPHECFPDVIDLPSGTSPDSLPGFAEGLVTVQDPAACLAARVLDPRPGERVLDACAAPGGKTVHTADLCRGFGREKPTIVASESSRDRMSKLEETLARLEPAGVRPVLADAEAPPFRDIDAVMLDAPCSGTGVLRKHPDARWRKREFSMTRHSERQFAFVRALTTTLRPGGRLVYSTCSLEREENELVVERALYDLPLSLEPVAGFVPDVFANGDFARALPHVHRIDGAFVALLRKIK